MQSLTFFDIKKPTLLGDMKKNVGEPLHERKQIHAVSDYKKRSYKKQR